MRKIIFVCTGNTCRSPMAEGLFIKYLSDNGISGVSVDSVGIDAIKNSRVSENSVVVAKKFGIDISNHIPRGICSDDFSSNVFFVCMSEQQKMTLSNYVSLNKIFALNVSDPFMGNLEVYMKCALQIQSYFNEIVKYFCLDLSISEMGSEDVIGISEIEKDCFAIPWSQKSISDELKNDNAKFYVAKSNQNIVGYIGSYFVSGEIYITNIAVKKDYRLKGIASELLNYLIYKAEDEKCKFITLEVRESNAGAVNLYKQFGFNNVGLRKNYYLNPKENAVLMTKYLEENDNMNET